LVYFWYIIELQDTNSAHYQATGLQFHPCKQFVSSATMEFHSKQKWAYNSISRHTNESLLCHIYVLFTVSYCPYCSTYYVHVLWLWKKKRGNRGLACKSPFTPGPLIDAPPPEWPRIWVKASPRPPPLLPGGLRGLPLSTPVTSLLPRPRNAPGVYSKAPPVPLPFSGGGDREGGPSFQCPLPSSLVMMNMQIFQSTPNG
jgi:hypothetical protein